MRWIVIFGLTGLATLFSLNVGWRYIIQGTGGAIVTLICFALFLFSGYKVVTL